jgi:TPR repeat protein
VNFASRFAVLLAAMWLLPLAPASATLHKFYIVSCSDDVARLQAEAAKADDEAERCLGEAYWYGRGTAKDAAEGVRWYQRAAAEDNPIAEYDLYLAYKAGDGVPQDIKTAIEWLTKASDGTYNLAETTLAKAYENGDGVPQDFNEALKWYASAVTHGSQQALDEVFRPDTQVRNSWVAAHQGDVDAQMSLAAGYAPFNALKAAEWLTKAAAQGNTDAMVALGWTYFGRDLQGIITGFSNTNVPPDEAAAAKWWQTAAEKGNATGEASLALAYSHGYGVPEDYATALKWWRASADQNEAFGQMGLGTAYELARGVTEDDAEAAKWITLAANQRLPAAEYELGKMYATGKGVPGDAVRGLMWMLIARYDQFLRRMTIEGMDDEIDTVTGTMSATDKQKADQMAQDWENAHKPS